MQKKFTFKSAIALWIVGGFLFAGGCLMSLGCAGKNATFGEKQQALASALEALRQSNFKGEVDFNEGGSLLGVNAATNWSLGPAQSTLHVRGEVDFTKSPRSPEATAPTKPNP